MARGMISVRDTARVTSKYGNRKITVDGETFDSQKEYRRWCQLRMLEKAGEIKDLKRQVKYTLIPAQKDGKKTIERECSYFADFQYTQNGETVVEDAKGMRTDVYKLKRKLMLYVHGIRISEV